MLMDAKAVAERIGVSLPTVYRLADQNRIPPPIAGRSPKTWKSEAVDAYLRGEFGIDPERFRRDVSDLWLVMSFLSSVARLESAAPELRAFADAGQTLCSNVAIPLTRRAEIGRRMCSSMDWPAAIANLDRSAKNLGILDKARRRLILESARHQTDLSRVPGPEVIAEILGIMSHHAVDGIRPSEAFLDLARWACDALVQPVTVEDLAVATQIWKGLTNGVVGELAKVGPERN